MQKIVKKRVSLGFNSENLYRSMKIYFEREMRLTDTIRDFTVLIRYTEIYWWLIFLVKNVKFEITKFYGHNITFFLKKKK